LSTLKLGVFASGRGSNFQALVNAIQRGDLDAEVCLLLSDNGKAGALAFAKSRGIPAKHLSKKSYPSREIFIKEMLLQLQSAKVNFIVLAGYMKMIPPEIIASYPNRIANIHPALLPSFGGKGMYGIRVHEAVLKAGCKETGVTIHLVDEKYDHGPIVAQEKIPVHPGDTAEELAARVLKLEHQLYWRTLQLFAEDRVQVTGQKVVIQK